MRKACTGSMEAARRAGMIPAMAAASTSTPIAMIITWHINAGDLIEFGVPGKFCTSVNETNWYGRSLEWAKERSTVPEQIVNMLRQIEVAIANGKTTPTACRETGITEQTFYRWRKEYGGLKVDQAKRLKELEQENGKLKRLVAELSLDKQILQDIARGNF